MCFYVLLSHQWKEGYPSTWIYLIFCISPGLAFCLALSLVVLGFQQIKDKGDPQSAILS